MLKLALFSIFHNVEEPVSVNIENPATVSKFSVSSYFAQIKPSFVGIQLGLSKVFIFFVP